MNMYMYDMYTKSMMTSLIRRPTDPDRLTEDHYNYHVHDYTHTHIHVNVHDCTMYMQDQGVLLPVKMTLDTETACYTCRCGSLRLDWAGEKWSIFVRLTVYAYAVKCSLGLEIVSLPASSCLYMYSKTWFKRPPHGASKRGRYSQVVFRTRSRRVCVELSVHGKTVAKSRWSLNTEVAYTRFYCTLFSFQHVVG